MKHKYFLVIFFTLLSCQACTKVVNHEKPNLHVDSTPFMSLGCEAGANSFNCVDSREKNNLDFNYLSIEDLLGGLTPKYAIASYSIGIYDDFPEDCVYISGLSYYFCNRYLIDKDGKLEHIETFEEFQETFAPVESPEEALGFALASGDYFAKYGHKRSRDIIYYVDEIEDTNVKSTENGYLVHLFASDIHNCLYVITDAVDLEVSYDGDVGKPLRYPVYRDTASDHTCFD